MDIPAFIAEYWTYLTIPAVSALVGFGTNWLAVKMMMYPLDFKGIGPFVEDIVDEVLSETSNYGVPVGNFIWSAAPGGLKGRVYKEVRKNLPEVLKQQSALDRIRDLIQREVNRAIEDSQGIFKPITVLSLGPAELKRAA